jgi:Zn-dependent peptidase ImmA (M78 family)
MRQFEQGKLIHVLSERQLRERVFIIVQEVRACYSHLNDPYALARELGYKVVESSSASSPMFEGASLDHVIFLRTYDCLNEERKRFTLYHEICHGLLRKDEWFWSVLHDQFKSDRDFSYVKERLCNIGAAEFLLPRSSISNILASEGVSVAHISKLANQFRASKLATAIQIADCATHECIMVVATRMLDFTQNLSRLIEFPGSNEPRLVVEYSMPSTTTKYKVARYVPIRSNSIIASAEEAPAGVMLTGRDLVPFKFRTRWEVEVEAVRLGSRIYALFNLKPPQPVDDRQLSLF